MLKLIKRGKWYATKGKNSLGVVIPRHTLEIAVYDKNGKIDKNTKKAAEARLLELEKATEWPIRKTIEFPGAQALALETVYGQWLAQQIEGSSTWKAYRTVKSFLLVPLAAQGVVLVRDVTAAHLNALQNRWLKEGQTLNTIQTWRKFSSCMFNYCVNFHETELTRNPWKPVPAIKEIKPTREEIMVGKRKDVGIATLPLDLDRSQKNWLLIQAHVPAFVRGELPGQTRYEVNPMFRHPDTWLTLLRLMYETGLRRSDAVIFRPDLIVNTPHGGSYNTAQVKTGDEVTCFLPQELADQLRALPLLPWRGAADIYEKATGRRFTPGAGLYPFYDGTLKDQEAYMGEYINDPLRELGVLLGIQQSGKESVRPHRFRDSFSVNMLSMGLSLEDLQRMLGHRNIATTQKYYAHYVLGMQQAVENRQAAARQAALYAEAQKAVHHEVSVN